MGHVATSVRQQVRRWPAAGTIHDAWTADDLPSLPDDGLRYEILDGTLVVSPSPAPYHQRASRRLARLLEDACSPDLEVFSAPLDWRIDDHTVVEPDLLVIPAVAVTRQRLTGTPMLIVEILSPSSRRLDRALKRELYAGAGVAQYWIVDPGDEATQSSVEVYDLLDGDYRLQARASGSESVSVTGPVRVTFAPADLVSVPQ